MEINNKMYDLIIADLVQNINPIDKKELIDWLNASEVNQEEYQTIKTIWNKEIQLEQNSVAWNVFEENKRPIVKLKNFWFPVAIVASLLLLISSIVLMKTSSNQELRLMTNKQSFFKDTLLDGSQIFLYPSTTLTLNKRNNEVFLDGEAFFVIPPQPQKCYTIHIGQAVIYVKGTSFRVNALPLSDEISVQVESGSVELVSANDSEAKLLVYAGEEAFFSQSKQTLRKIQSKENVYLIYKPNL